MAHSPLGDCREQLDTGGFGLQYGFSSEETCRLLRVSSLINVTHILILFVSYVLVWFTLPRAKHRLCRE
jgi:phage shock protein PspC (stress-responsive transcriptional regulator)